MQTAVVGRGEDGDQFAATEELVSVLNHLVYEACGHVGCTARHIDTMTKNDV